MATEHFFHRVGNLADRGARPRRVDRQRQQIAVTLARLSSTHQALLSTFAGSRVGFDLFSRAICCVAHRGVVDVAHFDSVLRSPAGIC